MRYSIIIPMYNAEKTIENTIESVVLQSYINYEIIIVNDGSTDNSINICKKMKKKYDQITLLNKKNGGVSSARNFGLKKASGDFICFLDSDDKYEQGFLLKINNKLIKEDADLCYCGYSSFLSNNSTKITKEYYKEECLKYYFLNKLKLQTSCFVIRNSIIQKNKLSFTDKLSWGEDFEFFSKAIFHSKKIIFLKENLVLYNNNASNVKLSNFKINKIDDDYFVINKIIKEMQLSKSEKSALLNYRLPALIVYRLKDAYRQGLSINEIKKYYSKYEKAINKFKFVNGIRSIKLYISINYIKNKVKK